MNDFNSVYERMKLVVKYKMGFRDMFDVKDKYVSEFFGIDTKSFSQFKKNRSIPFNYILDTAEREHLDLNYVLRGEGEMFKSGAESTTTKKIINGDNAMINVNTGHQSQISNTHQINYAKNENIDDELKKTTINNILKLKNVSLVQKAKNYIENLIIDEQLMHSHTPSFARC